MGLLDRVKANVQEAAEMAREGIDTLQTKRELGQTYGELGRKAFELIEKGELSHAELEAEAKEIRRLIAERDAVAGSDAKSGADAGAGSGTGTSTGS